MKNSIRSPFVFALSLLLWLLPALNAVACAPVYPFAIIIDWNHPDLPLKSMAAGNLGVIQPSWANSYLCVAYRYLSDDPLTAEEKATILRLWHKRLRSASILSTDLMSVVLKYLQLRIQVVGNNDKTVPEVWTVSAYYDNDANIQADAFDVARKTLAARIEKFGLRSPAVKEWLKGQDVVFGMDGTKKISVPSPTMTVTDKLILADRQYQIAAAKFYTKDYASARKLFQVIQTDTQSPWSGIAPYLVARCVVTDDNVPVDEKIALIQAALKVEKDFQRRQDLLDLLAPCIYADMSNTEIMDRLVKSITTSHSERFGSDVGDLTYLIDENNLEPSQDPKDSASNAEKQKVKLSFLQHDLVDWLDTMQRPYDFYFYYDEAEVKLATAKNAVKAQHAISQWRKTHSTAWLVALMSCNGLRSSEVHDAFDQARKLPPTSPAYLTASFFVVDALIHAKKFSEAKARVASVLAVKDLPPSARNLFNTQMMCVATSSDEFMNASIMKLPGITDGYILLPDDWSKQESNSSFRSEANALDVPVAKDLNRNLPLNGWLKLTTNRSVSPDLHRQIVAATWLRAQLLNKSEIAASLSQQLVAVYPSCDALLRKFDSSSNGDAKRFALARLVLRNCGMSPYVYPGLPRMGTRLSDMNNYDVNYWLPVSLKAVAAKPEDVSSGESWPSVANPGNCLIAKLMREYYQAGVQRVLSKEQNTEAERERLAVWNNHPSKFLGEPVLSWAKSHPDDPEIPELLYKVVRLPKWSGESEVGSKYSHRAYIVLHTQYPRSKWTAKATCWY